MVFTETDPASPTTPPLAVPTKPSMSSVERATTLVSPEASVWAPTIEARVVE
jgi:hypothetical protein